LYEEHKAIVSLSDPLDEDTGKRLAEWAAGTSSSAGVPSGAFPSGAPLDALVPAAVAEQPTPAEQPLTDAQAKKLDVLVGQLRDAGAITTEQVYKATGRNPAAFEDLDGSLHWSPLRRSLSKDEASMLIERLAKFAESKAEAA
jgi:hypothetical protein